jgi:hypothetical protein
LESLNLESKKEHETLAHSLLITWPNHPERQTVTAPHIQVLAQQQQHIAFKGQQL